MRRERTIVHLIPGGYRIGSATDHPPSRQSFVLVTCPPEYCHKTHHSLSPIAGGSCLLPGQVPHFDYPVDSKSSNSSNSQRVGPGTVFGGVLINSFYIFNVENIFFL